MSDSNVCCRAVESPVSALSRIRMNPNESQRSRVFRFCMLRAMSVHCAGRFPPSANRPFPLQSLPRITRSLTLALVLAVAGLSGCGAERESEPVNLLLVTLDTVRADSLGSYGGEAATSPNLDRLAAQSVRFETAISSAAVTPVAHASILTGLYPYGHGLRVLSADGAFAWSRRSRAWPASCKMRATGPARSTARLPSRATSASSAASMSSRASRPA
jgi:hypothetical protein